MKVTLDHEDQVKTLKADRPDVGVIIETSKGVIGISETADTVVILISDDDDSGRAHSIKLNGKAIA